MVINNLHLDLIHRSIDGELSESERASLDRILAESAPARDLHTQLLGLNRLRQLVPPSEPPSDLKSRILREIAPATARPNRRPTGETYSILSSLQSIFTPKLAYGLAVGLLLGLALGVSGRQVVERTTLSPADIAATLVVAQRGGESRGVDSDVFEQTTFSGRVNTQISDQKVFVQLYLNSTELGHVALNYDPASLRFWALEQSSSGLIELRNDHGQLALSHSGSDTYTLVFDRTASVETDLNLKIADRTTSYERSIKITK